MLKGNIIQPIVTCYGAQPLLENTERHYRARQSVSTFSYTNAPLFIAFT